MVPIKPRFAYVVVMTTDPAGQGGEPSNADLMAFMRDGFAHLMNEISGVKADVRDLRQDLRNTEVSLSARIDAVGHVVRSAKEGHARHLDDPDAHHRHAA